jgi:hypothetical protein
MKLTIFIICLFIIVVNSQRLIGGRGNSRSESQQAPPLPPLIGGRKELDVENDEVLAVLKDLSIYSLTQIGRKRASDAAREAGIADKPMDLSKFNYSLVEVVSAQSQVVAGLNYFIQIRMKQASCKRNCQIEKCDLEIYDRKWENFRNLTNFDCIKLKKQQRLGALTEIPLTNELALQALDFAIARINQETNDLFQHKLVKLNKAFKQVVAGFKYVFDFSIGRTTCTKNDLGQVNLKQCPLQENAKVKTCTAEIWDQPWLDRRYRMMNQNCTQQA